jgi:hypothetical protein
MHAPGFPAGHALIASKYFGSIEGRLNQQRYQLGKVEGGEIYDMVCRFICSYMSNSLVRCYINAPQ